MFVRILYKDLNHKKMKNSLLSLLCMLVLDKAHTQDWIPQGQGLLPVGYLVMSISAVDDSVIWVTAAVESVVESGTAVPLDHKLKVLRSIDGGFSWTSHDVATGRFSFDIVAVNATTAWITTQSYGNGIANSIFKTEDGGFTWKNKLIHPAAGVFLRRFDEMHLLCQTNKYAAWSEDDGESWNLDTLIGYLPNEYNTLAAGNNMASAVGDTLWVGTTLGRIVRFTDYGDSYEMIYTGTIYVIQSLAFSDHLHGMIFHYNGNTGAFGLSRTSDGGNTWALTPTKPQTNKLYNITAVPGTTGTFVAVTEYSQNAAEYFWTTDFGETWIKGGDIEGAQTNAVQFLSPTLGWVSSGTISGANEPIVYRWLGDLSTSVQHEYIALAGFEISPNPATAMIHYKFNSGDESKLHQQSILDLNGHVLSTKKTYSPETNISNLPAGTYFLRVISGDKAGVRMFVKVAE